MTGPLNTVFLLAQSEYRGFYVGIARKLSEIYGSDIHLYASTEQDVNYYRRNFPQFFKSIAVSNILYASCRDEVPDRDAVVERARRNEDRLGLTMNELAMSDRHFGRGYALGGFGHPRSVMSEETGYLQMLNGFNAAIDFWRRELAQKQPGLILNANKILCVLAREQSIPVRILASSRYRNLHYWGEDEFLQSPLVEAAYKTATASSDLGIDTPYDIHLTVRDRFNKMGSFRRMVADIGVTILRQLYWRLRRYQKAGGYYLGEKIAASWRRYRDIRRMTNSSHGGIADFADAPFVFFPLATEPEKTLQVLSPEYFYQLSAISSVSRDLPAGVTLAVKEHYAAVGRRPKDFYGQIGEFKNVRFMNMAELGLEAVRASAAVVTISGSGGYEGAILGKPVITFGRHNKYNFLPHVMVVTDECQLKEYFRRIFAGEIDQEKARQDGKRFLQAVIDSSFDLGDFSVHDPGNISDSAIDGACSALVNGFSTLQAGAFDGHPAAQTVA